MARARLRFRRRRLGKRGVLRKLKSALKRYRTNFSKRMFLHRLLAGRKRLRRRRRF